jgi:hypothetical protein
MSELLLLEFIEFKEKEDKIEKEDKESDSERLKSIEQDLLGLSSLMTSIRELVVYQAVEIDNIDENIKLANVEINKGVEEVEMARVYQQRSTRRKIKVMSGALIGGLLFGGVGVAALGVTQGMLAVGVGSGAGAFTGLIF